MFISQRYEPTHSYQLDENQKLRDKQVPKRENKFAILNLAFSFQVFTMLLLCKVIFEKIASLANHEAGKLNKIFLIDNSNFSFYLILVKGAQR